MKSSFRIVSPWSHSADESAAAHGLRRPFLWTNGDIRDARIPVCQDSLPQVESRFEAGIEWKRFELPASSSVGLQAPDFEELQAELVGSLQRQTITVRLENDLRRRPMSSSSPVEELLLATTDSARNGNDTTHVAALDRDMYAETDAAQLLVDRHLDLVNHVRDTPQARPGNWEGDADGAAVRSLQHVLADWRRMGNRDEPRMALIVRLARQLSRTVEGICLRPRKILRRERILQPVGRIQEVDSACLRWMARQPGRTPAEKAGDKQNLMSVARLEVVDTPENRLVRDFLDRAETAARDYLREHRTFRNHERVEVVRRFRRLLTRMRRTSEIAGLPPISGQIQPNYVLQYDDRYRKIWDAWLLLVRRRREQDQAWRWRHRIFAEQSLLAVLNALRNIARRSAIEHGSTPRVSGGSSALRSDLRITGEQVTGNYIDSTEGIGPWRLRTGERSDEVGVVWGGQIRRHPAVPPALSNLNPDYVLIRRTGAHVQSLSAVWTALNFMQIYRDDYEMKSLRRSIEQIAAPSPIRGIYLLPSVSEQHDSSSNNGDWGAQLRYHKMSLPLRDSTSLDEVVRWGLGI